MRRILVWMIVAAALLIGFVLYRSRWSPTKLDVAPDAAREIEKAKKR